MRRARSANWRRIPHRWERCTRIGSPQYNARRCWRRYEDADLRARGRSASSTRRMGSCLRVHAEFLQSRAFGRSVARTVEPVKECPDIRMLDKGSPASWYPCTTFSTPAGMPASRRVRPIALPSTGTIRSFQHRVVAKRVRVHLHVTS